VAEARAVGAGGDRAGDGLVIDVAEVVEREPLGGQQCRERAEATKEKCLCG